MSDLPMQATDGGPNPDYRPTLGELQDLDARLTQLARDVVPILRYFKFGHLPPQLQAASAPFASLAVRVAETPVGADVARLDQRTLALTHLLLAKDAAVRAALP